MKVIRKKLKTMAVIMIGLLTLQSCSVYHSKTATIDQAVQSNDRVKIVSPKEESYKFKRIEKRNGEIYGIAKRKSFTAKELQHQILENQAAEKTVQIRLMDQNIKTVHLKNKTASTILTIAIPIVTLGALAGIAYVSTDNMDLEWGN